MHEETPTPMVWPILFTDFKFIGQAPPTVSQTLFASFNILNSKEILPPTVWPMLFINFICVIQHFEQQRNPTPNSVANAINFASYI